MHKLGRDVLHRADGKLQHNAGLGHRAKVADLEHVAAADEHVFGLEVHVHKLLRVHVGQAGECLRHQGGRDDGGEAVGVHDGEDVADSAELLHHDEAVLAQEEVAVDGGDVGVVQQIGHLELAQSILHGARADALGDEVLGGADNVRLVRVLRAAGDGLAVLGRGVVLCVVVGGVCVVGLGVQHAVVLGLGVPLAVDLVGVGDEEGLESHAAAGGLVHSLMDQGERATAKELALDEPVFAEEADAVGRDDDLTRLHHMAASPAVGPACVAGAVARAGVAGGGGRDGGVVGGEGEGGRRAEAAGRRGKHVVGGGRRVAVVAEAALARCAQHLLRFRKNGCRVGAVGAGGG
eukprot:m.168571 g.168571  ORF g.168571 m.168571 type:complete len:349 (+) comp17219_c0_seq2:1296-2342(+)